MFSPPERLVAFRYLRPTREHGFVAVITSFALIGIALGVGTLIVVLAVMNGFRAELLDRVLGINGHASFHGTTEGITDFDRLAEDIITVDGVIKATPYIEKQVMVTANGVSGGALVRGLRASDLGARDILSEGVSSGSLEDLDSPPKVAIGSRMARRLGLTVGSSLTLISAEGTATAFGTVPRILAYEVGAIFEVGMFEYDNAVVFMPLAEAQTFFDLEDRVTSVDVFVTNPERIELYRAPLMEVADGRGWLNDWQQTNAQFFNALEVERNVMFLILTLIILVAAFNIITGLTMLVRSKSRDVAIMRTFGATRGSIMRIFFLSGMSIGLAGTAIGFALGLAFALNVDTIRQFLEALTGAELWTAEIRFLSQLPAKVEVGDTARVVAMGIGLSLLATLFPSWRAASLDPVEALRRD